MTAKSWFTSPAHAGNGSSRGSHPNLPSISNIPEEWTNRDIGAFGFTLSLALLGTILSTYTDRPAFWLLVGPGTLAIGFTALTLLRWGFGRRHRSLAAEGALRLRIPRGASGEAATHNDLADC
jgi:hypothetical protein